VTVPHNQVNFFLLFFAAHRFAPRYRDLHKRMSGLVGVRHPVKRPLNRKPAKLAIRLV
jgi:hypothetical protein